MFQDACHGSQQPASVLEQPCLPNHPHPLPDFPAAATDSTSFPDILADFFPLSPPSIPDLAGVPSPADLVDLEPDSDLICTGVSTGVDSALRLSALSSYGDDLPSPTQPDISSSVPFALISALGASPCATLLPIDIRYGQTQ